MKCESSTYSPGLADSASALNAPECESSLSVSANHTPEPSCESTGPTCPATTTCEHSRQTDWLPTGSASISSAEVSRARTLASQGMVRASQANGPDYGVSSPELLARFDRDSSLSKMSLPSFLDETASNSRLTAAYVAGLIDGEGCLWIQNKKNRWYTPRCDIGMAEKGLPVLRLLKQQYGGALGSHRKKTDKWEAAWRWAIGGEKCRLMLLEVAPFLVLKTEQARLLQTATNQNGAVHKALVSELNRKGPITTPEAGWFARHVGGAWLTPQADLVNSHGSAEFSETWPRSGLMQSGTAYRLPPLAPLTDETASGLLPTHVASNTKAVALRSAGRSPRNFLAPIPTPRPCSGLRSSGANRTEILRAVRQWPTPVARDYKGQGMSVARRATRPPDNLCSAVKISDGSGSLNPTWVEWLMGFPAEWTALDASATPSSRKSRKSSGGRSSPASET